MRADPFRRPPMVDIPADQADTMWQRWTHRLTEFQNRHTESKKWRKAASFADLCELSAQFCEGKLAKTPDHGGPRCDETVRIAEPLAHANRHGFLTTGSQPGEDVPLYHDGEQHGTGQQRAAVEGWAHPDTAAQLRRLFEGTRIPVRVSKRRKWRADYSQVVNVSRYVHPSGDVREETHFGFVPSECTNFIDLGRPDLTAGAVYVTVHDPNWGDRDLLWRRLSVPDWDNPPPLADEDRAMPAHIPAGREDLWRRQAEADAEVRRLTALYEAADRKAERLNRIYPAYHPMVRAADAETERINTEVDRAEAVAERVHQERAAGLSSWIDESPHLPICSACGGTGGPPGSDAHSACKTCRGWGREDDGTPTPPVWSEQAQQWIDPATGQPVDLLTEDAIAAGDPDAQEPSGYAVEVPDPYDIHGPLVDIDNVYDEDETLRAERDQAAEFGDLAGALRLDDALEDMGERATCHQCQSWADHAHDQITNRRVTLDEWEGRAVAAVDPPGASSATVDMPPAAEPFRPPDTSAPRDATSPPTTQGATEMNVPGQAAATTVLDRWDQFFTWLFKGWGYDATARPNSPHAIAERVDAKLAAQSRRTAAGPPEPDVATVPQDADTRPQPAPQDLDALASTPPPPRTGTKFRPPPPKPQLNAWSGVQQDWCSCEGNAHDARCRFTNVRRLDVSGSFPPPPDSGRGGAAPEPASPTQP